MPVVTLPCPQCGCATAPCVDNITFCDLSSWSLRGRVVVSTSGCLPCLDGYTWDLIDTGLYPGYRPDPLPADQPCCPNPNGFVLGTTYNGPVICFNFHSEELPTTGCIFHTLAPTGPLCLSCDLGRFPLACDGSRYNYSMHVSRICTPPDFWSYQLRNVPVCHTCGPGCEVQAVETCLADFNFSSI